MEVVMNLYEPKNNCHQIIYFVIVLPKLCINHFAEKLFHRYFMLPPQYNTTIFLTNGHEHS